MEETHLPEPSRSTPPPPSSANTITPPVVPLIPSPITPPVSLPPIRPPVAPIPRPPLPPPPKPRQDANDSASGDEDDGAAPSDYQISEESRRVRERQEQAVQELLMKRRSYALAVPTNDAAVRARLRRLDEPVTLFGEREMERRDRLRTIMTKLDAEGQLEKLMKAHEEEEEAAGVDSQEGEGVQSYPFFTEGTKELLDARIEIAKYSFARAKARLRRAKRKREDPDEDEDAESDFVLKQMGDLALDCSEIGDDRPLTGCSFSPDSTMVATWYAYLVYIGFPLPLEFVLLFCV